MWLEEIEKLKTQYTDKYVVADDKQPELRRFKGLTGQVKTVNMSGRALVQFEHEVDISWYDIALSYLKVVDAPAPKPAGKPEKAKAEPAAKPAAASPKASSGDKPAAKKSPLELAREQAAKAAASKGGAAPAGAPAAPKKSPIELAREQAAKATAAKSAAAAAPAEAPAPPATPAPAAAAEAPKPAAPRAASPVTGPDGRPLSKIELARIQGAFKG